MGKISVLHGKTASMLLIFIMMMALTIFSTGCEALKGDDDDSDGGSGTVTAVDNPAETSTTAKSEEPEQTETATPEPTPTPEPEPATPTTTSYPQVGGKGILWKPISEGNRMLVVLLATYYGNPGVKVLDSSLNTVENGNYVGRTNGNRATYRFGRPGHRFPAPAYLEVGGTIYKVPDPSKRYE